jgi:hypothetical protein
VLLAVCLALAAGPLSAQEQRPLAVRYDAEAVAAVLAVGPVLAARELADAVTSGVPIRMRLRAELWRDGFTDKLVESNSLTVIIVHEPLSRRFFVRSSGGDQRSRAFDTYEAARAAVEREYPIRLLARRAARYYYTATVDVETFSPSDLDELERWLQGDLQPAVSGDQSIAGAVGHGAKRLLIRVLGVPNRHYEARSRPFRVS